MNPRAAIYVLGALLSGAVQGQVVYDQTFTSGFANGGFIPDDDLSGWTDTREVSGVGSGLSITDVTLQLNIADGWNGDLYGYLRYEPVGGGAGIALTLFDRPGHPGILGGYGESGFAVTLSDLAVNPIQSYGSFSFSTNPEGQLLGTWQPNTGGTTFADAFGGLDPNGNWTLFFSDQGEPDVSQLLSWSLQIQAVPEPTAGALIGLGAAALAINAARRRRCRKEA